MVILATVAVSELKVATISFYCYRTTGGGDTDFVVELLQLQVKILFPYLLTKNIHRFF